MFEASHAQIQAEDAFRARIVDIEKLQSQNSFIDKKYNQLDIEHAELCHKMKKVDDEMHKYYLRELKLK